MSHASLTRNIRAMIVMSAFLVAVLVLHGVVAYLTPLAHSDWDHLVWARTHRDHGIVTWLQTHYTLDDGAGYLLARWPLVHSFLTPLALLATMWGIFVHAYRRRPRFDDWEDVIGIVLIAALLWITAPRMGLVSFHRPYASQWLYGSALALWFLAPLRCGWRPRGLALVAFVVAGYLVGTAGRQLGLLVFGLVVYAIKRSEKRERWMWAGLAAVTVGTILGFLDLPFDFRGLRPTFELSLTAMNLQINENGELITLVIGLVLCKLALVYWPKYRGDAGLPDTSETLWWVIVWFLYCPVALLGPRYSEATLLPASIIVIIAAFPTLRWIMTSPLLRKAIIVLAIAINVIAWSTAISVMIPQSQDYRARIAKVRATPRNTVVTLSPYRQVRPTFWVFGEDWFEAARRQLLAAELFRLRDIDLAPSFRRLEGNPQLAIRLEVEGVTPEQLTAAGAPEIWTTTMRTARRQFERLVKALRANIKTPFSARLVVALDLDVLHGRELVGAVYDADGLTTLQVERRQQDDESKITILIKPKSFAAAHPEAYTVVAGKTAPTTYGKSYKIQALTTELHAVVACDPKRCYLVDAFIPAL